MCVRACLCVVCASVTVPVCVCMPCVCLCVCESVQKQKSVCVPQRQTVYAHLTFVHTAGSLESVAAAMAPPGVQTWQQRPSHAQNTFGTIQQFRKFFLCYSNMGGARRQSRHYYMHTHAQTRLFVDHTSAFPKGSLSLCKDYKMDPLILTPYHVVIHLCIVPKLSCDVLLFSDE